MVNPYICVCGPLGAGKTTISKLLAAHFGWSLLLEDLSANPYLRDYYADMHRWGFHVVTAFLAKSALLADELSDRLRSEAVCQDWHFAEHFAFYGVHVFQEGILDRREYGVCEDLHHALMAHAPKPDLVIVLTADPGTLLDRIAHRLRPGEQTIPRDYVDRLVPRHMAWAAALGERSIVVNTALQDVVHDPAAQERFIAQVAEKVP